MPNVPCRGDIFHALHEITPVVAFLENRAYDTIAAHDKLQRQKTKLQQQARRALTRPSARVGPQSFRRRPRASQGDPTGRRGGVAGALAGAPRSSPSAACHTPTVAYCSISSSASGRRAPQCPHRLNPVCTLLQNHRDQLLAFALQLDEDLAQFAAEFEVPVAVVREMLDVQQLCNAPPNVGPKRCLA